MEGRYYVQQVTPRALDRALECYERAIRLDPCYALPHSGVALQAYYRVLYLAQRPRELVPAALAALGRALQLDAGSAQSHVVRGVFSAFYEYNWKAADEHFLKALEMDPASAMVRVGRALWFLLPTLRLEEALSEIKRAVGIDPFSPAVRTTELWILHTMRRPEAVDRAREIVQMFPGLPICRFAAGLALLRHGLTEEAVVCVEEGLKIVPGDLFLLGVMELARGGGGPTSTAEHTGAGRYVPFLPRVYAAEACGDMERAQALLEQAVEEREPIAVITVADRRADWQTYPGCQALLRKMNLAGSGGSVGAG
jgi:hypothetical protein